MAENFTITDEQKKALEAILADRAAVSSHVTKQEAKFDAFNALIGPERILTEIKSKLPVSFRGAALVSCDPANSREVLAAMVKLVSQSNSLPVIVLMNYNYKTVLELFKEISFPGPFIIVDTVSKGIFNVSEQKNVVFVDSLRNLTQLQIKIINLIESNSIASFIFDSIGMLTLYHEEEVALKFVYSVTKLLHRSSVPGFFISAGKASPRVSQFFDEEVELKKFL